MYRFSNEYYSMVEVEKSTMTEIKLSETGYPRTETRLQTTAIIKLFDGIEWREQIIYDVRNVQETMDRMIDAWNEEKRVKAKEKNNQLPDQEEYEHLKKQFQKIPGKNGRYYRYGDRNITHIPEFMKQNMCKDFYQAVKSFGVKEYHVIYQDKYSSISIIDSNGNDTLFDEQKITISLTKDDDVEKLCNVAGSYFDEIAGQKTEWQAEVSKILNILKE